jgi:Bacterial SH3 domain
MSARPEDRAARLSFKIVIALSSCLFGLGLMVYGFGAGIKSPTPKVAAEAKSPAEAPRKKPARAWNIALGDVVIVAPELGFSISSAKATTVEQSKVVARIEGQLQKLRELYRQEGEKNPGLMGNIMLQLNVGATGDVTQVKEIGSRIPDGEFKKEVIAEVSHWSFAELLPESVTINCPLLFIREGMDITTLLQWEKSLALLDDKPATARGANQSRPNQQAKTIATPRVAQALNKAVNSAPRSSTRPAQSLYQIKYATSLRAEPNFSSPSVTRFTTGTKVSLLNHRGDWLEVRATDNGFSGYIRKEFVVPVVVARKQ